MTGPLSWSLADVAAATGGEVTGNAATVIRSVTVDSRRVDAGGLFVAIEGERFDGHDFAAEALVSGAAAVLVAAGRASAVSPRISVRHTGTALLELAAHRRAELSVPVIAVTGSTGKTSTKDMLSQILPGSWASPASYNNEVGVPLTVLGAPRGIRHLVAEVGSRAAGDITWLMPAVRPGVAIITNLGVVHLETFGSVENLAAAKWELIEGLDEEGIAVLPANEPRLLGRTERHTITFGSDPDADVRFEDLSLDEEARPSFTLRYGGSAARVFMHMAGEHQPRNAAAAAAAAFAIGTDFATVVSGLEAATGSPGRMEIHRGPVTVVNDAYNANPDSVEAALRTVSAMPGRHVAVLGLMAELGVVEEEEHLRMGALARSLGFAAVVVVGDEPGIAAGAGPIARRVATADEALRVLDQFLREGDVVLVKASHVVGLDVLARRLAEEVAA